MYKCRLLYDEWKCIKSKEQRGRFVSNSTFEGYIGDLRIIDVSEKQQWKYKDTEIVVCDNGYRWISVMPKNEFFCMTVMLDNNNNIKVCYVDMIESQGVDADEIPYFMDLYLDLIIYPDGNILVDDMDELEEALAHKEITKEQYHLALKTAKELQEGVFADYSGFEKHIKELMSLLDE